MAVTLMKGKLVHLYQDEQNLKISSGTDIFDFPVTCKSDELPIISDCLYSDTDPQFHIFSTELSQIFSRLIGCVSFEETRYYLNGVFMHEKNGKLCAVTTDGHRLRLYETDHDCPSGFRGILPFQFIIAAIEAIKTDNQIVTLRFYDQVKEGQSYGKAEMIAGGTRLRTKIIDGIYPDYQKVMPENIDEQIRVTSLDLKSAITKAKTASRCTDDNLKSIKLSTYDDNLCIRVNDGKPGFEYTQYIQCEGTLSKPLCADVNYISGLVKDAPGDTILLGIQQDDLSKYVIDAFSITSESDPVTSILMPVKASS
jgi:DNA polymerase-3 subunit beta